ncbi:MAG TPA: sugar ABC transporter ATP-binding protein [Alphaproteobacteria bacterium]
MSGILVAEGLSKSYGGVPALEDVSFSLAAGEIRAICGENGAGKSTFVKMIMGIVPPDSGTIAIDGTPRSIHGPRQAQSLGLGFVAQELSLAPHLSILDNIWLGSADVPLLHRSPRLRARAQEAMTTMGVGDWDLDRPVSALTLGQRQIVEIARLLARNARILILDEPTATLSDIEIAHLIEVLKTLRNRGRSVIYISHRLGEVFEFCDTVSVFRNGRHVVTAPVAEFDRETLIEAMLGRSFQDMYPPKSGNAAKPESGLRVAGLTIPGAVSGFSFVAPAGKVVCIAGQVGSGASAVTRALAGLVEAASGEVSVNGRAVRLGSVREAIARDILFITEDRAAEGIFPALTTTENVVATRLGEHSLAGFLSWPALRRLAARLAEKVSLARGRLRARAAELSGGNQQKLVFARAVERPRPGVLLMNEPTRGIDVGARAEIYRLIREFCAAGHAVIMTSSDLEEVVGMADIVYTMYRGRLVARYEGAAIDMALILRDIAHPDPTQEDAA